MEFFKEDHVVPEVFKGVNNRLFIIAVVFYSMLVVCSVDDFFFWDTVQLASKHAGFFLKNGLVPSFLPNELDSGHIPAFGYFIACIWTVFGKTLIASHLCLLPFIWIQIYFLKKILDGFQLKYAGLLFILCLLHPTLIAQNTLVSPDVVLMGFFLMSVYAMLNQKQSLLIVGAIGLVLISNRGVMVLAGLGVFDFLMRFLDRNSIFSKITIRQLSCYLPAAVIFLTYSFLHYSTLGWIGFHEHSPWNESFRTGGADMFVRNLLTVTWRFNDFGLWFPVISGLICIFFMRRDLFRDLQFRSVFFLFLCISVFLILPAMLFFSLSGHRYLMPSTLILLLLSGMVFTRFRYGIILITVSMASLLAGHLYVYPETLSQGWDSSLAYKPYIKLRSQMVDYMDRSGILFAETATFFPNKNTDDHLLLNGSDRIMKAFDEGKHTYVFYSNVYNVADKDQQSLYEHYTIVKQYYSRGVKVVLFKIR